MPLEEIHTLFNEGEKDGDDSDSDSGDDDGDEESSLYSGTPNSSRPGSRASSRTRTTRQNSSSKLLENGNNIGMMRKMFDAMRGKSNQPYTELGSGRQ